VQKRWNELTADRTEIDVLVGADLAELKSELRILAAIEAFRSRRVVVIPGGGGKYGEIRLPKAEILQSRPPQDL